MRLNFKFVNLFGTAYKKGNLSFTSNGMGLFSPVGNQITLFDLARDEARTLKVDASFNICHVAVSPHLSFLIAFDENGNAYMLSLLAGTVISQFKLRYPATAVSFSPNGEFLAIAKGHSILVFHTPSLKRHYNQMEFYRMYYGASEDVKHLDWSSDSRFFIAGSDDTIARVYSVKPTRGLVIYSLTGHNGPIKGAYLTEDSLDAIVISADGHVVLWECDTGLSSISSSLALNATEIKDKKALYKLAKRHFYFTTKNVSIRDEVTVTAYHKKLKILITGFESGLLMIHMMPDFTIIDEVQLNLRYHSGGK
ncbi:unnamed protein product [Protopolystoma xenopodis]|uniref:Uncharacterized protein n=1 Tax=Protopolystoma xenopodis TaxID=117903 RepID=A0A3S5A6Z9_9PLAT|nr:unnamed protein product [Protopolystoma xenopodis]